MFIVASSSLFLYMFAMFVISVANQLLKFAHLDTERLEKLSKEAKAIKKQDGYNQLDYVKKSQSKKDISFNLIYYTIITLIVMFSCMFMIEKFDPLIILNHKLGMFSIILLLITEGYITKVILTKIGIR